MSKPKVGFYWCASCGGCEEAVVDLNEGVLDVVEAVDIIFWPVALDFKRSDVEAMADGEIAVSFINGAIRNSEQREMVEMLRRKSGLVVAFGSCSHLGGIPGLANLHDKKSIFNRVYHTVPTIDNPDGTIPQVETAVCGTTVELPEFWDTVRTLDQVIDVDYYLPGCAPPVNLIVGAVTAILEGKLPEKGAVLAPDKALCDECDRRESKPENLCIDEFKRPYEIIIDEEECLLAQGLLCLGSATRAGCDSVCVKGNMPCTGCMGPTSRVNDFGAKALSAMASVANADNEDDIKRIIGGIADPVGSFNKYSLPASYLHRKVRNGKE